jgi:hypothetical protein
MSPNGDGDNDVFTIDGIGAYPQNSVKISNSNGDIIYSAIGYDNYLKAFDGHSANGTMQKAATFLFPGIQERQGADRENRLFDHNMLILIYGFSTKGRWGNLCDPYFFW